MLTAQQLREILHYDPVTGTFTWLVTRGRGYRGTIAGYLEEHGYITIGFNKFTYYAHHLAWFYIHGEWPSGHIDHINRVKNDNRIVNLRIVTKSQNSQNSKMSKNNTSGFKGVHRGRKGWSAQIRINYVRIHLGTYPTPEEASAAYRAAAEKHFGQFAGEASHARRYT